MMFWVLIYGIVYFFAIDKIYGILQLGVCLSINAAGLVENPCHIAHARWSDVIAIIAMIFNTFPLSFVPFAHGSPFNQTGVLWAFAWGLVLIRVHDSK